MRNSIKKIVITVVIGLVVFVIGNLLSNGFQFNSAKEFLVEMGFYQLYSFVLGYSNMYFFDYLEKRHWRKNDTVKRILIGVLGCVGITLVGLFLLRAFTSVVYFGSTFEDFLNREKFESYQFGLWITLSIYVQRSPNE